MRIAMMGSKGVPASYGGVETHVRELARRLARRGHDVTVYSRTHCTPKLREYEGVRIVRLPAIRQKILEMASHTVLSLVCASCRSFDLIHFHSVDPTLFAPLVKWRAPIVSTSHGQAYRRAKWGPLARWASRRAELVFMHVPDARIAVSRTLQRYYEQRYHRRVVYIPNGVDVHTTEERHDALDRNGLIPGGYMLFAGRLDPTKGCHLAIDGYLRSGIAQQLVVLGASTYTDAYATRLHAFRSRRILFLGHLSGSAYWQVLQNARALVFPSEIEGLSLVLLEAMSQGLPVIYSDIPENEELAGGIGFAFHAGDVRDLGSRIAYVAAHPEEARARGAQARARVRRDFGWEAITDRTEQVYREVLASRARAKWRREAA